jgi:hypothetical protein
MVHLVHLVTMVLLEQTGHQLVWARGEVMALVVVIPA